MVQPWALALFKCAHHVQLWDKTGASAPVCIRLDYKADKTQSGGLVWENKIKRREGKKREIMQEEKEKPSQKSQGSRAAQTNRWLHKQATNCVVKHQFRKPQLWAAADVMGSTAFIPSVFLHQGACLIRQEGLPFSDPGPPTAVHRNAHLNSNGGELHRPPSPPFSFPRLSRFILRLINRTQLLTGSFLQNRGAFLVTYFSWERARSFFF